jgi:hypothetical protein
LHRANIAHKECEWKDGDRGGLAEWEQTERKKKEKAVLDINRPSHGRTKKAEKENGKRITLALRWVLSTVSLSFPLPSNQTFAGGVPVSENHGSP